MSLISKLQTGVYVLVGGLFVTGVYVGGVVTGCWFYPALTGVTAEADHDGHSHDDHDDDDHDHGAHDHGADNERTDHIAFREAAFHNLGLTLQTLSIDEYWKSLLVPGEVVEVPGRSNLSVSAPVSGMIQDVRVLPGEAVSADTVLCTMTITDEDLVDAQSSLIDTLSRMDLVQREIDRLEPLTKSGAVAGKKLLDSNYQLTQLQSNRDTLVQQLLGRGLPEGMVKELQTSRTLITSLTVNASPFADQSTDSATAFSPDRPGYSIESLDMHPGVTVDRGAKLCSLSFHETLYVQGIAFESDLPVLNRIMQQNWSVSIELQEHLSSADIHDDCLMLNILRIDNHVDRQSRSVRFFATLPNDVERTTTDSSGRLFQQWQFRPGQRAHIRLPEELWADKIVVPADAVALDGPAAMIFAEYKVPFYLKHPEDYDMFIEFEPVPVRLLHRDSRSAVIEVPDGFRMNRRVAMNGADKLYLAVKMKSGEGGGHDHHHDH